MAWKGGTMKNKIPEDVLKEIFQKKLKRTYVNGEVYTKIKKMIVSGKLKKGERLIQEDLSLQYDVSRQTIRTALTELKKEGMIVWKYKKGTFVA
jgi:DNA-binding GntR family transcriptional regulator